MEKYNDQLDQLFVQWQEASDRLGDGILSKDGLMRKLGADVNELWDKAPHKVMFLLKDQPDGGGDDTRNWLVLPEGDKWAKRNREARSVFLKRLALLLYGFTYNQTDYWAVNHQEAVKCFNEVPFAFVETKKQSGEPSVANKTMDFFIDRYKDFLLQEIRILHPNIIVCCGGPQYQFALNTLYSKDQLECIDQNAYYDKAKGILVIYAPHPSVGCSHANYYAGVMWHYGVFLQKYPNF